MLFPFGMNRRSIRLWHSLVPFSQEEYGWVKYTFSLPSSNRVRFANSEPLSPVMVLNTSFFCVPKYSMTCSSAAWMTSAVWFSACFAAVQFARRHCSVCSVDGVQSVRLRYSVMGGVFTMAEALREAIPEFLEYNIVECSPRDVSET